VSTTGAHLVIRMMVSAEHTIVEMTWLAIAVGGALGAMARHGVNHLVHVRWLTTRLPIGTAVVNVAGCFVIGLLAGLLASERLALRGHWREFLFVGLLGGFTTFSTFGLDTFLLTRTHSVGPAAVNVVLHVVGGLVAVWLGYQIGAKA
jgi:CrcB protein